jgi:hypothetical protein
MVQQHMPELAQQAYFIAKTQDQIKFGMSIDEEEFLTKFVEFDLHGNQYIQGEMRGGKLNGRVVSVKPGQTIAICRMRDNKLHGSSISFTA